MRAISLCSCPAHREAGTPRDIRGGSELTERSRTIRSIETARVSSVIPISLRARNHAAASQEIRPRGEAFSCADALAPH